MRDGIRLAAGFTVLLAASVALAVSTGDELFVRARNTQLRKDSSAAAPVLAVLQPGQKVIWNGPDPKGRGWHRVTVGDKTGVVLRSNLWESAQGDEGSGSDGGTAAAPAEKLAGVEGGAPALSDGPIAYGQHKVYRIGVDDPQASTHARNAGLLDVVGSSNGVQR